MSDSPSMDLRRLRELLDAYGGDPARWPESERAAALALLASSDAARTEHTAALAVDAVLDAVPAATPSPALAARIVAAAPALAREGAGTQPVGAAPRASVAVLAGAREKAAARRNPLRFLAAAVPLAAAAGLALWIARPPQPETPLADDVIAELGTYGTPGDALLTVSEVDVLDDDPWTDCSNGGLGCLDLEAVELDPLSGDVSGRTVS